MLCYGHGFQPEVPMTKRFRFLSLENYSNKTAKLMPSVIKTGFGEHLSFNRHPRRW
jgi:hypothetical protein